MLSKIRIKKSDMVKVLSGKDKGKSGRVLKVLSTENRVVVEGINMRKRHRRARKQGEKGQVVQLPGPVHVSNLMLVCPSCSVVSRTRMKTDENGKKFRTCVKCGAKI